MAAAAVEMPRSVIKPKKRSSFVLIDWYNNEDERLSDLIESDSEEESVQCDGENKDQDTPKILSPSNFYGDASQKVPLKRKIPTRARNQKSSLRQVLKEKFQLYPIQKPGKSKPQRAKKTKASDKAIESIAKRPRFPALDMFTVQKVPRKENEASDVDKDHSAANENIPPLVKSSDNGPKWTMAPTKGKRFEMKYTVSTNDVKRKVPKPKKQKTNTSPKSKPKLVFTPLDVSGHVTIVKCDSPKLQKKENDVAAISDGKKEVEMNDIQAGTMQLNKTMNSDPCSEVQPENTSQPALKEVDNSKCDNEKSSKGEERNDLETDTDFPRVNSLQAKPSTEVFVNKGDAQVPSSPGNINSSVSDVPVQQEEQLNEDPVPENDTTKESAKLYPVFEMAKAHRYPLQESNKKQAAKTSPLHQKFPKLKSRRSENEKVMHQLIIDAGQKEIGTKVCQTCGMVYTIGEPEDEMLHSKHHNNVTQILGFSGWKKERIASEFSDGKIVIVQPSDPKFMVKKVEAVVSLIDRELGIPDLTLPSNPNAVFLLFVTTTKDIAGCIVAEPIEQAYHVIPPTVLKSNNAENSLSAQNLWCVDTQPVKALCGISRLWTAAQYRRQKIATRLVDALRCNFVFGFVLALNDLAFSDPTAAGRAFAQRYTGVKSFLVYR